MPIPATSELPKPKDWNEFEDIVWEIYTREWQDSYAARYGRSGQVQHGIDIYGKPKDSNCCIAIQCKRYKNGKLTNTDIEKEVNKTQSFTSEIKEYIIATTESRDTKLQDYLQELNNKRNLENKFLIYIVFWEDICNKLATPSNSDLLKKYYSVWEEVYKNKNNLSLAEAKKNYLKKLRHIFNHINLAGIDVKGENTHQSGKLANIFVAPNLEEEILDNSYNKFNKNENNKTQQEEIQQRTILATGLFKERQSKRALILGTPGSGKTALISYFLLSLCGNKLNEVADVQKTEKKTELSNDSDDFLEIINWINGKLEPINIGLSNEIDWLPIVIRIRELALHSNMSILDFARYRYCADLPNSNEFFEYWLREGRGVIFFDGLDEVGTEKQARIVEQIKLFLETYPQNRVIITSRPIGNPGRYFSTKEFPHYHIQPFHKNQIIVFINRWYESIFSEKSQAIVHQSNLRQAIFDNARLKQLASNPLLLTIILLIHREQKQLPKRRNELYDCAINTLLDSWDKHKEIRNHEILQYLVVDDLRWLMARLAYWIHTQGGLDEQEGGILIERDTLLEKLCEYIQDITGIKYHRAEAEAKRFLDKIIGDRAGLISNQSDNLYGFVHKTFQEYLTAEDIYNRAKEQLTLEPILSAIKLHLHEPHWNEVIFLLVAKLKQKDAIQTMQAILENNSEYEQWLHRDLLFAGRCLTENLKQWKQGVENIDLVKNILNQIIKLKSTNDFPIPMEARKNIRDILLNLSGTIFENKLLRILNQYASKNNQKADLIYRLALGGHEEAVDDVLQLLKNKHTYKSTIETIRNAFKYSNISDFLIQNFSSNFHGEIGIAEALNMLGYHDDYVSDTLNYYGYDKYYNDMAYEEFQKQQIEEAQSVYSKIKALFSDLTNNPNYEAGINELINWLGYEDYGVNEYVAKELGKFSDVYSEIEIKLLEEFKGKSSDEYFHVVLALGYLRKPSENVITILISLLHNDENIFVCANAAKALSQLNISHDVVKSELLKSLKDVRLFDSSQPYSFPGNLYEEALYFNSEVFKALVQLSKTSNAVAPTLAQWIEENQDKEDIRCAVNALWQIVEGSTIKDKDLR
ncbi:NACHT domain-containing protein [Rivularia sp. UHCC 0363]|uniref:NACHT domain-containing protein n=1 Tax=Rivularia sp. UHCC 0363 TaxID=3110244 RepID=UPI002B1FB278|nr:NACHT domain-containing protein [Rivularia sp. UHCC 0363]MEA5593515.1 NACHT domain-containing protein [Rivularia sp. UHCC 0363]